MTNADLLALLARDGMGGFGGVSKSEFLSLSYRDILESYFAEFEGDDRELVPLRQRRKRWQGEKTGKIENAATELPTLKSLDIPPEVLGDGVPMTYMLMFWSVWRKRNQSTEYILERWKRKIAKNAPRGKRRR